MIFLRKMIEWPWLAHHILLCLLLVQRSLQDSACKYCEGRLQCPAENSSNIVALNYTTAHGHPVADLSVSITAGERGPVVLHDRDLIESIVHFNRERIPERVVHAKGAGAFGYFKVTSDEIVKYCKADLFSEIGKTTPVVARFSNSVAGRGGVDSVRDTRGFAVKFYTRDGIWDLTGFNTLVFGLKDAIKFTTSTHAAKPQPTGYQDANSLWNFFTQNSETLMVQMSFFSANGIPDGHRHMDGRSLNTFKMVNASGHPVYCRFYFKTDQGIKNLNPAAAATIRANDPDYALRDLYTAIAAGNFPSWTLYAQKMTYKEAECFPWNPFDPTKFWPEEDFPNIEIGKITLDKNPISYFADMEQAAFCPGNMVPGMEVSPDKVLQARMFSYQDAQRYRLGVNFAQLPVNCPFRTTVNSLHRDGHMRFGDNFDGRANYYPNSFNGGKLDPRGKETPYHVTGDVKRFNESVDDDDFSQPALYWKNYMDESQRDALAENIADSLILAKPEFQKLAISLYSRVNSTFGQKVTDLLGSKTSVTTFVLCSANPTTTN